MDALSRPRRHRRPSVLLFLAGLIGALLVLGDAPASAQGYGWFGNLFGGGSPQQGAPSFPNGGNGGASGDDSNSRYYTPRHRAARRKRPQHVEQAQDQAPVKPKAPPRNASLFVDVFGDSLGQMLAGGLDDALADRDDVAIVHKAKGSTGLVNTAYYDWPKAIDDLLAGKDKGDKIDVAVMMIGVNDRQPIVQDGKTLKPGSAEWNALYAKRVLGIDEAFAKKKIPLIWVGVPITKDDDFADDMAALNDIYRDAASKTGATYVDTWEPFSDDNGDFAAFGPDVNGQVVRLRSSDGIHFTKAGARKLAHFVETPLRRDLDGKTPLPQLPTGDVPTAETEGPASDKKDGKPAAVAVVKPEAGPIKNLGEPPAAKGGELAQIPSFKPTSPRDGEETVVRNAAESPPPGRADDFRWQPDKKPQPASAPAK